MMLYTAYSGPTLHQALFQKRKENRPVTESVAIPGLPVDQVTPILTDVGTDGLVQPKVPPEAEY